GLGHTGFTPRRAAHGVSRSVSARDQAIPQPIAARSPAFQPLDSTHPGRLRRRDVARVRVATRLLDLRARLAGPVLTASKAACKTSVGRLGRRRRFLPAPLIIGVTSLPLPAGRGSESIACSQALSKRWVPFAPWRSKVPAGDSS